MTALNVPEVSRNQPYERPCDLCGEIFKVKPGDVRKALKRGHNLPRFCSRKCQTSTYKGAGNPKWRGGRVAQTNGYICIYAPDHPYATQDGYVREHRLVMEQVIGRHLHPSEHVHHRNHVRDDNRPENLELMNNASEHRARHAYYEDEECGSCGVSVRRSIAHRRRWVRAFCSRKCSALAASRARSRARKS